MLEKKLFKRNILITLLAAAFFAFLFYQNSLAEISWDKYRNLNLSLALNRSDSKLAMRIGDYYFNGVEYDLEKAARAYKKALSINGRELWGHHNLARIYFLENKLDRAIKEADNELSANPENLRALYVRGLALANDGNLPQAEADFKRFIAWSPQEWAGYNDLAWVLMKEGKNEEAKKIISDAFSKIPGAENNAWLWNNFGVADLNLENYKKAESYFKKALELSDKLTVMDWRKAYPGNDPQNAKNGIMAFRRAVAKNLERSRNSE